MELDGKGVTGRVHVDDAWVTITRKGVLAKANYGFTRGEKRIPIASITSVQFKKPRLSNGYIQFSLAGGIESRRGVLDATKDENSVVFGSAHARRFEQIRDFIEGKISERSSRPPAATPPTATGVADELTKLACSYVMATRPSWQKLSAGFSTTLRQAGGSATAAVSCSSHA